MTVQRDIQINELLFRRELLFAQVHKLEQEIHDLLGREYPLQLPEDLPSARKPKKGRKKAAKDSNQLKMPRAEKDQLYRIRYLIDGEPREELHSNRRAVEAILAASPPRVMLLGIDCVSADGTPIETANAT